MSKKVKVDKNQAKDVETKPTLPKPDYRQALQFIDNVVALSPVNRQAHIQAQQALVQLGNAVTELEILRKKQLDNPEPK